MLVLPGGVLTYHVLRDELYTHRLRETIALVPAQRNLTISQMACNKLPEAVQVLQALRLVRG
jgi:hypothetical protein